MSKELKIGNHRAYTERRTMPDGEVTEIWIVEELAGGRWKESRDIGGQSEDEVRANIERAERRATS